MAQTSLDRQDAAERRFEEYLEALGSVLGHADRRAPMHAYCTGLLLPGQRKSVEPLAARVAPQRVQAAHQSLHHFVAKAEWSDEAVLDVVRMHVLPLVERHGPIRHWIIDDTGVPKKGKLSVGVARQYCGQLGKQDNCQVAVTLSVTNEQASLPIAYRLYLPQTWADDPDRRRTAGVPEAIGFETKPQIALAQVRAALAKGVPRGLVLSDAGYGLDTDFRTELTALDLRYVVGVQSSISLWPPGQEPLPAKPWSGVGRPPKLRRRDEEHTPISALDLAKGLPARAWRTITWREGTNTPLASRFAAVRVRPAHRDYWRSEPHAEEWLLIEWLKGEKEPSKYWLSTLPKSTTRTELVAAAKGRWRIERDYRDLKQEVGLGHFEGRGWRGFHHHASLCIAAYGFLITERCLFPPEHRFQPRQRPAPAVPAEYKPRGACAS